MMISDECAYFAYGSNLHPLRLQERVPSANLLGITSLAGHQLVYGKRGIDGSGKCTTVGGCYESDYVLGAVFTLRASELGALDAVEGPAYQRKQAVFRLNDSELSCFYYEASDCSIDNDLLPFDWYRDLVILGARYHQFPAAYVASLGAVPTRQDADPMRQQKMLALLARMSGA